MRLPCLLAAAFAVVVCTQPEGLDPGYSEPMINGYLYRVEYRDGSVEYERDVSVFDNMGLRMVPVVVLNGDSMRPYYYSWSSYRYGDEVPFPVHYLYELDVTHFWGEAFSRVVMPGNFRITLPPGDTYIFDLESTMVVTWRSSKGAQWYWVDLYCDYDYLDSNYVWDDYSYNLDTVIEDTFVVLSWRRVFPSFVMDVLEGDGSVLVWAGYGPPVEPGDYGNVHGNGFGFFNGFNEPPEKYFWVGAPIAGRRAPRTEASRRKLTGRLRERTPVGPY